MIFPIPDGLPKPRPSVSPAAMAPRARVKTPPMMPGVADAAQPVQRRPAHDVQMMRAVSPSDVHADRRNALYALERNRLMGKASPARPWYEDPIALGTLLILVPPIGLAALWSSKRYSNDARWALTLMTALTLCLGVVLVIVVVALRS